MSTSFRRKRMAVFIGFLFVFLALVEMVRPIDWIHTLIQRLDYAIYDYRLKFFTPPQSSTEPIVIIDIDERSLKEEGHWPWPRYRLVKMLDILKQEGALVVAFDIVFAEAERNSATSIVEASRFISSEMKSELTALAPQIDGDLQFSKALYENSVVLGFLFHHDHQASHGFLPQPIVALPTEQAASLSVLELPGFTGNIGSLNQAATGAGFITNIRDEDDIIRRSPLIIRYNNQIYNSLALEAARLYLMSNQITLNITPQNGLNVLESVQLGNKILHTDAIGQVLIPYLGASKTFPYISAIDVLQKKVPEDFFKNKVVLIGTTALGLEDLRSTPWGRNFSGVEVHANIAHAVIAGHFSYEPHWAKSITFLLILILGSIFAYALPFMAVYSILFSLLIMVGSLIGGSFYAWQVYHLSIPVALPILLFVVLAIFNEMHGYLRAKRRQNAITNMFSQYVPKAYVRQMSDSTDTNFGLQGENREMTILFSDIRSFTSISEKLSAQEVKQLLNKFFTPMTKIIFDHDGTIDKYVGDMVMAFWGAPLVDEAHAYKAVTSALDMVHRKDEIKEEFRRLGLPEIEVGIGLNTGWVNVGDMGSEYRRSYTVLGDAVNLASRIESLTKYYGVPLLVGEATQQAVMHICHEEQKPEILFRHVDRVKVKGKTEAVDLYEPINLFSEASGEVCYEVQTFNEAKKCYHDQKWEAAEALLQELQLKNKNYKLYMLFLDRIAEFRKKPPETPWDGSIVMTEK